jgi:protoporphyrinogen oxidase
MSSDSATKPQRVVIIGAGPAGLAAGLRLTEAGVRVEILEAESRVGGLCATIPFQGRAFDLGGHRFMTTDAEVRALVETLLPGDLLVRPRRSVILLQGKTLQYPVEAWDMLTRFGPVFCATALADYALTWLAQQVFPRRDSSFEQWVVNRFGTTLFNLYFGPYSEKLWGLKPSRISARWAPQRISLMHLSEVLFHLIKRHRRVPKTYAPEFLYPRCGIGQICEAMAARITALGGVIRLDSPVVGVDVSPHELTGVTIGTPDGHRQTVTADMYVNTSPLPDFLEMTAGVSPRGPGSPRPAHFRAIRCLNVSITQPCLTPNTWIYVPEPEYPFFRIQDLRNWSPTIVPEGKGGLILEIACNEGDDYWRMPDDELWAQCFDGLRALGLMTTDTAEGYFSTAARCAYPLYSLTYDDFTASLSAGAARFQNLRTIGRQGLFRYNNMDHSLKMGLLTARHLSAGEPFQAVLDVAVEKSNFETPQGRSQLVQVSTPP